MPGSARVTGTVTAVVILFYTNRINMSSVSRANMLPLLNLLQLDVRSLSKSSTRGGPCNSLSSVLIYFGSLVSQSTCFSNR